MNRKKKNKKQQYNRIKLIKLASALTIGKIPSAQVVPNKKLKKPRYKENYVHDELA